MKIKIPVQNTVEIIVCDITVECTIRCREQFPAQSTEAKMVLEEFKSQLSELAGKFAHEITRKVTEELEPK